MIVDTHAHVVPATLLDALRAEKRLFPSVKLHDAAAPRMEICRERVGSGNFIPTNANAHAGEGPLSTLPSLRPSSQDRAGFDRKDGVSRRLRLTFG
jgi:hypothetical protein